MCCNVKRKLTSLSPVKKLYHLVWLALQAITPLMDIPHILNRAHDLRGWELQKDLHAVIEHGTKDNVEDEVKR